jgi:hypothetical protein
MTNVNLNPSLESVLAVEKTIKRLKECDKKQLLEKLPEKMSAPNFQAALKILESSNKIMIDKDGTVIWVYDPAGVKRLVKENLIVK